jgi:hypothetical protein
MSNFSTLLLGLLAAALVGGCALPPYMPLSDEKPGTSAAEPVYLMTVVLRNDFKQRFQPRVTDVVIEKDGSTPNSGRQKFRIDDKGAVRASSTDGSETFLVRFTAGPGSIVAGMNALASAFPIHADYFVPLYARIPSMGPGFHYLGSVRAVIRERKDSESPAGNTIPVITQAIAGASTGTFDVELGDSYAKDVEMFRAAFPALKDVSIANKVLTIAHADRATQTGLCMSHVHQASFAHCGSGPLRP